MKVELYASTDGPDTDFMAKLVDVYPDGYEALVLDAPIRTRFRNGREPQDIRMMTPGAPEKLTIDLWPTAITFESPKACAEMGVGVRLSASNGAASWNERRNCM